MTIYTSSEGSGGSKVSVHKTLLLSALTLKQDKSLAGTDGIANSAWSVVSTAQKADAAYAPDDNEWVTFAATELWNLRTR